MKKKVLLFLSRFFLLFFVSSFVLGFVYLLCLHVEQMKWFSLLLDKMTFALGGRVLSLALLKLGLSGNMVLAVDLALRAVIIAGVAQYMVLPDEEGTPGTKRPRPSSSSSPGSSPSIPEQGQPAVDQREGSIGGSFPSLSSIEPLPSLSSDRDEVEQAAPDLETQRLEVGKRVDSFLSSYNKIAVRGDFLIKVGEELKLHTASEEELNRIKAAIESVSSRQGSERPTSARNAAKALFTALQPPE